MKTANFAAACLAILSSTANAQSYPPITVIEDGIEKTLYVQYPASWSTASTQGDTLSYGHNNRMYLSESPTLDTASYYKPNLLGGVFEYTVDLSQVGCGCVSALYAILMPALDNSTDPFKYCDANQVGGHWCPEFDIQEANKHVFHATGHECDAPTDGVYHNCDRGGQCTLDVVYDAPNQYGPGSQYTINTEMPYTVKTEFHEADQKFTGYTMTFSQEGRSFQMTTGDCSYLNAMSWDMTQMVFSFSHWESSSLDWLQHGVCAGSCNSDAFQSFSDLKFTTTSIAPPGPTPGPTPEPDNGDYTYGSSCTNLTDDYCGDVNNCSSCKWSWPTSSALQWDDPSAACRCEAEESNQDTTGGDDWVYGSSCANMTDDYCGDVNNCSSCKWSWPTSSALQWDDPSAACRCEAGGESDQDSSSNDFTYGSSCANLTDDYCSDINNCNSCKWSWPTSSALQWDDPSAACRCEAGESNQDSSSNDYAYGSSCANLTDDYCGDVNCASCKWSWPTSSALQWDDPSAACRCEAETEESNQDDNNDDYTYGSSCANLTDEYCGDVNCASCKWSWPTSSTLQWDDPSAACRCEAEVQLRPTPTDFTFGDNCASLDEDFCADVDCASCKQSWPINSQYMDPQIFDPHSACRCESEVQAAFPPELANDVAYVYGNECTGLDQDKSLCDHASPCHMSWPADDPLEFLSAQKACRTLPKQRAPEGYRYASQQCSDLSEGTCDGSCDCRRSVPLNDPLGWLSSEKMCRCKPAAEPERQWGTETCGGSLYTGLCGADCHDCLPNWFNDGTPNDGQCRCKPGAIREIVWGAEQCASTNEGQCGGWCRDCRKSWELTDTTGTTLDCRCKNWW